MTEAAVVFVVRYGSWSPVEPMLACAALESHLNHYAKDRWRWNIPRWADAQIRMMSVVFENMDLALTVLKKWTVPSRAVAIGLVEYASWFDYIEVL